MKLIAMSCRYKELKKRGTVGVRALVRNAEKARALLGCGECGEDEGVFVGDVTKPGTLTAAMEGISVHYTSSYSFRKHMTTSSMLAATA